MQRTNQLQHYHMDFQVLKRTVPHHIPAIFFENQRQYIEHPDCYETAALSDTALIYMHSQIPQYMRVGISVKRFSDVDEFVASYLTQ